MTDFPLIRRFAAPSPPAGGEGTHGEIPRPAERGEGGPERAKRVEGPGEGRVSIIAIVAANGVIGRDNALPWHMSTDLKRFKSLTMGHHMIMGRKTFESLEGRILPGRPHIIVTRRPVAIEGVQVAHSIDEALALAAGDPEPFICGGAEIYRQSMHRATRMYITQIHAEIEGDTFFPEFDDVNEWKLVDREDFEADEKNDYPFSFLIYERA